MRAVKIGGFVIAGIVAVHCAIYDTSLLLDRAPDASPNEAGADADSCNHAVPPPRPVADDPSDGGDIEFITALSNVDFGLDGGIFGFDLDHVCTCPGPESCVPQTTKQHCDDSQGRDNAGGALIQQFSALTTEFNADKINTNIASGLDSMLLRVRNYNGTANDTQVSLAVFVSTGTTSDAGTNTPPKHDGNDHWGIDPSSLVGTPPPYVAVNEDLSAYVTNGVLVASVSFPFGLGQSLGPNFLRLDGAYLVGVLTKSATGYSAAGVITGRWDTRNLLTGMQGIKDPLNKGMFLCGTDPTYQGFKTAICAASDVARAASLDNSNAPCDALSTAVGFRTEPALLGDVLAGSPPPQPCGATYSDQCGN